MKTVIFPSTGPDLDGVACAVAYAELLSKTRQETVVAAVFGEPDPEARFLISEFHGAGLIFDPETLSRDLDIVYVDASSLIGFPAHLDPMQVSEVVDHRLHGNPGREFPNARLTIELVGAAATIVGERFAESGHEPTEVAASLVYGAIQSNTQCLKGAVTTDRDRRICQRMESLVPDPSSLLEGQLQARREFIVENVELALDSESKQYVHFDHSYEICQLELTGGETWFDTNLDEVALLLHNRPLPSMLNVVDVDSARSLLFVPSEPLREFVSVRANMSFHERRAVFEPAILRKQIVDAIAGLRELPPS